jgi:hypothetical protein
VGLALAALPGAAAAAYWLVGDLSEPAPPPGLLGLDYAVRPPAVPGALVAVAGSLGLLLTVVALARLRRHPARPALVRLAVAGVLLGWSYRVATAGVIGANIGYGLVLLIVRPLLLVLLVSAAVQLVRRRPERHQRAAVSS